MPISIFNSGAIIPQNVIAD
uniref:Uncharacterized protein MANES_03G199400 n=1 Tax=Rhizophora mucronata TaxID=61149 RepID=A0A2P2Q5I5_RHIMU